MRPQCGLVRMARVNDVRNNGDNDDDAALTDIPAEDRPQENASSALALSGCGCMKIRFRHSA